MSRLSITQNERTKVLLDGKYIKLIPVKYAKIFKKKHLINPQKKRLTQEERFLLEVSKVERDLKQSQPLIYNLIKHSQPKMVRKITNINDVTYFELVYKNAKAVKVGEHLFDLSIHKETAKRNF